jgi:hypothetical protein
MDKKRELRQHWQRACQLILMVLLSNADRQRMHRQQDKGYDEHAAGGGPDSGFHGWVHATIAAS